MFRPIVLALLLVAGLSQPSLAQNNGNGQGNGNGNGNANGQGNGQGNNDGGQGHGGLVPPSPTSPPAEPIPSAPLPSPSPPASAQPEPAPAPAPPAANTPAQPAAPAPAPAGATPVPADTAPPTELSLDEASAMVSAGSAKPLATIVQGLQERTAGEVVDAKLLRVGTSLVYAVKMLSREGQLSTEYVDAGSGVYIRSE